MSTELTDLEICKKIAKIEGLAYCENKGVNNEFVDLCLDENVCEYNPLTDDALCFQFCYTDSILIDFVDCPAGSGRAYFASKNGKSTDYQATPNMAVCLAKLGIFERLTMTKWQNIAPTPPKGERMPMTEDQFYKVIAMRDELIFEQKEEISKLKMKVNKLTQQLNKQPDKF